MVSRLILIPLETPTGSVLQIIEFPFRGSTNLNNDLAFTERRT